MVTMTSRFFAWEEKCRKKGTPIRASKVYLLIGAEFLLGLLAPGVLLVASGLGEAFFELFPPYLSTLLYGMVFLVYGIAFIMSILILFPYFNQRITLTKDHLLYQNLWRKERSISYSDVIRYKAGSKGDFDPSRDRFLDELTLYVENPHDSREKEFTFSWFVGLRELYEVLEQHRNA